MAKKSTNNLNVSIFAALKVSEVSRIPVLLLSNPGIGKTTTVYMFAKQRGYEVVELRGNSTTAEEVNGYDVAPKDVTFDRPTAACHLRPSWFEEVLKNQEKGLKTLLFLDEITTANEFVQSALLKLIFDRTCGREPLPEDTLIISAGNYSNNLTSSMSLLPPVMNRFMIYNIIPTVGDLDVFLNRYKGSAIGKPENYSEEISKTLAEIDANQKIVSDNTYSRIGELFESAIKLTCQQIISGNTKVDLSITDLQGIYNNLSTDPRVYGFISFRTLTYLRDVAISWYLCFGKEGISSSNFRNAIDGLCGVGLHYKTAGKSDDAEVLPVYVGEFFHNSLQSAASDCEKLNNETFEEYATYFGEFASKCKSWKTNSVIVPEVNAAINKFKDLSNIKELQEIERPVDENILREIVTKTVNNISTKIDKLVLEGSTKMKEVSGSDANYSEIFSTDKLIGNINEINSVITLLGNISKLVKDPTRSYTEGFLQFFDQLINQSFTTSVTRVQILIKSIKVRSEELKTVLPELVKLN